MKGSAEIENFVSLGLELWSTSVVGRWRVPTHDRAMLWRLQPIWEQAIPSTALSRHSPQPMQIKMSMTIRLSSTRSNRAVSLRPYPVHESMWSGAYGTHDFGQEVQRYVSA